MLSLCANERKLEGSIAGQARVRRFGFPHTTLGTRARLFAVETATGKKFAAQTPGNLTRMPSDFVPSTLYWPASESLIRRQPIFDRE